MFTGLQNAVIHALRVEPKVKTELVEEIAKGLGFAYRGVQSTVTRIEHADLIKNNEGILTLTKDGLSSIESQGKEFEMSGRLVRGRRL